MGNSGSVPPKLQGHAWQNRQKPTVLDALVMLPGKSWIGTQYGHEAFESLPFNLIGHLIWLFSQRVWSFIKLDFLVDTRCFLCNKSCRFSGAKRMSFIKFLGNSGGWALCSPLCCLSLVFVWVALFPFAGCCASRWGDFRKGHGNPFVRADSVSSVTVWPRFCVEQSQGLTEGYL